MTSTTTGMSELEVYVPTAAAGGAGGLGDM